MLPSRPPPQPAAAVPAEKLGSQELRELVQTMLDTMRAAPGVGLAAPQIGVPLQARLDAAGWQRGAGMPAALFCLLTLPDLPAAPRLNGQRQCHACVCSQVIVLEDREEYMSSLPEGVAAAQQRAPFEPLVIINPRLTPLSGDGARFFEGCLSVPGYQASAAGALRAVGRRLRRCSLRLPAGGAGAGLQERACPRCNPSSPPLSRPALAQRRRLWSGTRRCSATA